MAKIKPHWEIKEGDVDAAGNILKPTPPAPSFSDDLAELVKHANPSMTVRKRK